MKKINELKKRIETLNELILNARNKKEEIISFVNSLTKQLSLGRISKREYYDKLGDALKLKSPQEWINYYDNYIEDCKLKIIQCRQMINEENFTRRTKFSGEPFENSLNNKKEVNYSKFSEENSFGRKETAANVLKVLVMIVFIGVIVSLFYNFGPAVYDSLSHTEIKIPGVAIGTKPAEVPGGEKVTGGETISAPPMISEGEFANYKPVSIVSRNPRADFVENTEQGSAVVGENVKWESQIEMKSSESFDVNIPRGAKILSIKDEEGNQIKSTDNLEGGKSYSIEFETPAPTISKEVVDSSGERVEVTSEVHYKDILSSIEISKKLGLKKDGRQKLKLYQIYNENGEEERIPADFMLYDTNEDGIVDHCEWVVDHLSSAVFEFVIIEITKAEHLDVNRGFISDIYDQVKTQDGIWSEKINNNEYVRVNFELNLTNQNDITIYARSANGGIAEIEVYAKDNDRFVAKFENISSEETYKVYLSNLAYDENYGSFDLKIASSLSSDNENSTFAENSEFSGVEFDYIVDPIPAGIPIYYCTGASNSLDSIRNGLAGTYYLAGDIDCAGVSFTPIGTYSSSPFSGILNGNYHKIKNLNVNLPANNHVGLFGYINGAKIYNLDLESVSITGQDYTGGIVGRFIGSVVISNCSVSGNIAARSYAGGIVGGGLSGSLDINNSYTIASISGTENSVGGIVGQMYRGSIINSYSTGGAGGVQNIGGIVGFAGTTGTNIVKIVNSYSVMTVSGTSYVGQLVGRLGSVSVLTNNYAYNTADSAANCVGSAATPSSPGCTMSDYYDIFYNPVNTPYIPNPPVWDFINIWKSQQSLNSYPVFKWQNLAAGNSPTGLLCGAKNSAETGIVCEDDNPCPPGFGYTYVSSWGGGYRFYHCYANQNLEIIPSGTLCGFANYNSANGWSGSILCNGYDPKTSCPTGYSSQGAAHDFSGTTDTQYYCVKSVSDSSALLPGSLCGRANYNTASQVWSSSILCQGYDPKDSCPANYGRMNSIHHGGVDLDYFCAYNPNNLKLIPPTPANNGVVTNNYVEINVSAPVGTVGTLTNFLFNWQDINYTIYNESLVLMMNFDNNPNIGEGGSIAVDVGPYGLTGSLSGVSWNTNGKFGGGISSTTANGNEISINNIPVDRTTNSKTTVAFWMKWNEGGGAASEMPFGWDNIGGYDLILYPNTNCFGFNTGRADCNGISSSNLDGKWVYVTAVFKSFSKEGVPGNGELTSNDIILANSLYIDGVRQTITRRWEDTSYERKVTNKIHVGGWGVDNTKKFGGLIDELRIWNRSLSDAEVAELYMSNLKKHNSTNWYFYVNQTESATTPLQNGLSYSYYACDKIPNENCTEQRSFSVNSDTTPPVITIITPLNNSNINSSIVMFNVSSDKILSWCGLSKDDLASVTMNLDASKTFASISFAGVSQGIHNFLITCSDTSGNYGITNRYYFLIDTVYPAINVSSPVNSGVYGSGILFNVSSSETGSGMIVPNLDNSLVSWWRMDDVDGTGNPFDYLARNNGVNNGATQVTNGKFGRAFSFDGVNDYVLISSPQFIGNIGTGPFTIALWAKDPLAVYSDALIGYGNPAFDSNSGQGVALVHASSPDYYYWILTGSSLHTEVGLGVSDFSSWKQFVLTRDSSGTVYAYIDGFVSGSGIFSGDIGNSNLKIGTSDSFNNFATPADAQIDEVMIFNRSLNDSEILGLYNATKLQFNQSLNDGKHNYKAYVSDLAGNVNSSNLINFNVDTINPWINFTYPTPANNAITPNSSVFVNVSISEANLNEVKWNWNGINYTIYNDSLVLMYNLDNRPELGESSSIVKDLSKYGNDGNVNGATPVSNGKYNGAFSFDGNNWIRLNSIVTISKANTVSFWANPKNDSYDHGVFGDSSSGSYGNYLSLSVNGNTLTYVLRDNSYNYKTAISTRLSGYQALNSWHYYSFVFNSSGVAIYSDGIYDSYMDAHPDNFYFSYIGTAYSLSQPSGRRFNGSIDEVRIWNRSLTASEIYEQYVSNLQKFNTTQWYLYVNQSKNSTAGLDNGDYTYFASAMDLVDRENRTETRFIQIVSSVPDIISISSLNSKMTEADVTAGDRTLGLAGASKPTTFDIYVYSSAGVAALPQGAQMTATNVYVTLVYIGSVPATQPGGKQLTSKGTACSSNIVTGFNTADDDIDNNNVYGTKDVVKYICTVQVPYYIIYGSDTNRNWDVRGYVEDLSSPTPNKEGYEYLTVDTGYYYNNDNDVPAGSGPHVLPLRQTYFNRQTEWKIENNAAHGTADFGTVTFGDPIDKQPTALSQPRVVNYANAYIEKTQLQASNLQDAGNGDDSSVPATWFYSEPTNPCGASAVQLDLTLKDVMQTDIPYGPTSNSQDLKLCLKKILAGAIAPATNGISSGKLYSTSPAIAAGGIPWNVDATFCLSPGGLCP